MLGVHSSTVKRWAESGHFKTIRSVGGHRKVALVDVENLVRRNTQQATQPNLTPAPVPAGEPASVVDFVGQQQERATQGVSDPLGLDDL